MERNEPEKKKLIDQAQNFYSGFYLTQPVGNNAFSFQERKNKKIYVPPLINGGIEKLSLGERPAFCEVDEGQETCRIGLKNFIYFNVREKCFFIFDNHNHAFFFWVLGCQSSAFLPQALLVHIDQHTDMREPEVSFSDQDLCSADLGTVFKYTNFDLNVGNFIKPALHGKIFSRVKIINTTELLNDIPKEPFVLDLDLDFFSDQIPQDDFDLKIIGVKEFLRRASFVTIATSPYFMDQNQALKVIKLLI